MLADLETVASPADYYALGGRVRQAMVNGEVRTINWESGSNGPFKSYTVYDPVADQDEIRDEYGIEPIDAPELAYDAVIGAVQEYSAQRSAAALKAMVKGVAHAVRDGNIQVIAEPEADPEDLYGGKD